MPSSVRVGARWIAIAGLALAAVTARAATFTVTTTADSGAGSLRQAILDANGNPGADTVAFAIPAAGVQTISVASALTITDPVTIDGYTQPGSSVNTDPQADNAVLLIDLQGNGTDGLFVNGSGTAQIRGLVLHGFLNAIRLSAGGGSFVAGCWIGLLPSGQSAPGNAVGVLVHGLAADAVGDDNPANRNVISGNGVGVQVDGGGQPKVQGNLIGLSPAGSAALGNGTGVSVSTSVLLGGTTAALGNVISGNATDGVHVNGNGSTIRGNRIGLDATGFLPLGNGGIGVFAHDGALTIDHNFVSANASHAIEVSASGNMHVFVNYIGTNVFGTGELGNGGAGVHSVISTGTINSNVVAHNRYGLWIESQSVFDTITWSSNSIYDNGGLGIVGGNPPSLAGPIAVITSIVPNATTTTIAGFVNVPVGAFVPSGVGLEFFSSPACSKKRPADFDEGKTLIGTGSLTAFGSPTPFTVDVPVVITDEVVTVIEGFNACVPLGEGGCVPLTGTGGFSQRLPRAIDPASGSPAGGDPFIIVGNSFEAGATVTVGGAPGGNVNVVNGGEIDLDAPALPAGAAYDVTVVNPSGSGGTIPLAWLADFLDVPQSHPFHDFVRHVVTNGVANGVGGGNFGVDAGTLRQQMAVFLLKAKHGICYAPPPCAGVFSDVSCPSLFADWIEALAAEGITGGCGGGNYCPGDSVRRDQMAAFLLKAEHGSAYVPPPCAGVFADVACPSLFADWIEQLAAEQVTGGCGGGNYCPSNPNTRGQMAVFLTKTFALQ